jgi:hypothetical protein
VLRTFEWLRRFSLRRFLKNRAVARLYKVSVCFKFKVQGCQDAKKAQNLFLRFLNMIGL